MLDTKAISPGQFVNGRYEIQRVLGEGGIGRTYLVRDHQRFKEPCALKEFAPCALNQRRFVLEKSRQLFLREAQILHQLKHPQIPQFLAFFPENDRLFLVQEYVKGKTYEQLIQERQQQGQAFSEAEVLEFLRSILKVLDYIHAQGIVHRDIAPDNIMLSNQQGLPVLIDFGIGKQVEEELIDPNSPPSFVGKQGYAPLEQVLNGKCFPTSDLYSLAVTALVLLTGKRPYELRPSGSLAWDWRSHLPMLPVYALVLDRMLAFQPDDRYPSAQSVLAALSPEALATYPSPTSQADAASSAASLDTSTFVEFDPAATIAINPRGRQENPSQIQTAIWQSGSDLDLDALVPTEVSPKDIAAETQVSDRPSSSLVLPPRKDMAVIALGVGFSITAAFFLWKVFFSASPTTKPIPAFPQTSATPSSPAVAPTLTPNPTPLATQTSVATPPVKPPTPSPTLPSVAPSVPSSVPSLEPVPRPVQPLPVVTPRPVVTPQPLPPTPRPTPVPTPVPPLPDPVVPSIAPLPGEEWTGPSATDAPQPKEQSSSSPN
jgi:serine/threonine-protein kinase